MYELEFTPNQAKSYQVGFDLTTEPVGDYVANTDYLSIDTWDNNSYVSNVVLDGGLQLSGDVISGTVTITTTNSISSDFVLNITMRYNDTDNSINKTISQTIQMTNNLGGLDQVAWKFDVGGDIVATRDYGTGTETLSNVTITLFPKNQNGELPGIAVGKLDEIFDLAATTVYLDSKDQQTFQSVNIVSYNYKDSNDSFIFVLSPTIKLSNEGRNADHIELVFHTTYGSTTYNAEIPWSITINKSNIPDMYYIPSENKMSTEYIDIDTEGTDLLNAAEGQAYMLSRDAGISNSNTGPFITYNCTMDLYLSAMKEDVSYVVQPYFDRYDISGVIIKGKYIRYFITESKTSTVISGPYDDDIYLQNGYKNGELTNSTVESTGNIGWNEESFDYYRMVSEFGANMLAQGYHKTFHFESGKTYYIYPVIGFRGVGNPIQTQDNLAKIDCDIRVALLGQKTPPEEMEGGGGVIGSIELTNVTFNPNNFNIEYDTDSLEAEFSIDVSDRGLYTIDPKKLNIDTFSVTAGSNITGLNVSMNTGTTKYENGKLNGSILIQFNPGVTMVSSTILRVSFEYNDEENSINDTIEGNITFNYLNRSIDLQSMAFNPSTIEYSQGDTVSTQFTITYTSQNYTPEKLNVKLISGLLADGSPTNSKFTITTSSIIIDSSTIKGTLNIAPNELADKDEYTYNIEIGYEDPDDDSISDSVTQQLTLRKKIVYQFDITDIKFNDNKDELNIFYDSLPTRASFNVYIYYTRSDNFSIGELKLIENGRMWITTPIFSGSEGIYLDEDSLSSMANDDTSDNKKFVYSPTLVIPNFDYNNGEAPFELHFSYIDEELNISDAISGTGYIRKGFRLTYLHYNNNVNEFSAEFESFTQSPTYYSCFMYVGVDNGYNNYTPKPECLTVECVRDGNSSGTFDLSVSGDISYEADNNRFYVYALFTYQNVADAQFYANITFKYKDEEMEIDSTVTNRITFIPKKNSEEFVIEDIRLYPESNTVTKGANSTIYYYIEYRVDDLSQFTDEDGSINENVRYEHNGNLPYSSGINLVNFGESKIIEDAESPGNQRIQFILEISSNKWQGSGQYTNNNFKVTIYNKFGNSVESEALSIGIYVSLY